MKNLELIAAIGPNKELGYKNKLLWHIKEDLAFYKQMTMNKNIIMGRLTLESMPKSALIGRKPIILTRSTFYEDKNILTFNDIEKLLQYIETSEELFMVVGGASIYSQFLEYINTMYLTHISSPLKKEADCYFPHFNVKEFEKEVLKTGTQEEVDYQICKYTKKRILEKK